MIITHPGACADHIDLAKAAYDELVDDGTDVGRLQMTLADTWLTRVTAAHEHCKEDQE